MTGLHRIETKDRHRKATKNTPTGKAPEKVYENQISKGLKTKANLNHRELLHIEQDSDRVAPLKLSVCCKAQIIERMSWRG